MANFRSLDQFGQQRIVELPPPLRERRHRAAMRQACVPAARHAGEIAFIGGRVVIRADRAGGAEHNEDRWRSEEHTSELQSLMRISYAVFCLKKKTRNRQYNNSNYTN